MGALDPFPVATPWWQDIAPVVEGASRLHGIDVTVLRFLEAERPEPPGGEVTYLAETASWLPARSWAGSLDDHPLRLPYARPGGPRADLEWARSVLCDPFTTPPQQIRTWNLSSVWRLETSRGAAWLKVVPPFLAHEGDLIRRLFGECVPALIAHDGARMLMAPIPGEDLYEAVPVQIAAMIDFLVDLQVRWSGAAEDLVALGVPDARPEPLHTAIAEVVGDTPHSPGVRRSLRGLLETWEKRWAAIADCGIPHSLVHGDFHPGNFRGRGLDLTLLDWGDSLVGHPLLDLSAFLDRIPPAQVAAARDHWFDGWRRVVPGSDPARAADLIAPIAAARQASIYHRFLAGIEPSEHPYHRLDPARWLARAARLLRP
ncbi:MAG: aminoglycoside phosphotransferase family protein [Caulobacteraceae bacterium]|nr:aminoglycoside phosphotransferase family protein [Caulobacteraceae bacterium]